MRPKQWRQPIVANYEVPPWRNATSGFEMDSTPDIVRFFSGCRPYTPMMGLVTNGALKHFWKTMWARYRTEDTDFLKLIVPEFKRPYIGQNLRNQHPTKKETPSIGKGLAMIFWEAYCSLLFSMNGVQFAAYDNQLFDEVKLAYLWKRSHIHTYSKCNSA